MRGRITIVLVALLGVGGFAACGGGVGAVAPIDDEVDGGDAAVDGSNVADAGSADADASATDAGPEPAGAVDTAFGDGGLAKVAITAPDDHDTVSCLGAIGSLLVGSQAMPEGIGPGPAWAAAFHVDGTADTTFAAPTGRATLGQRMSSCVVDAKGRLVASIDGKIERWSPQGAPDVAFAHDLGAASVVVADPAGGYVTASAPKAESATVTWLADDGSTSASTTVQLPGASEAPASAVVLPSGAVLLSVDRVLAAVARAGLDASFGNGGTVAVSRRGILALAPNGEIVFVHSNVVGEHQSGVLVERFTTAGTRISSVDVAALAPWAVPPGTILVQPNGKSVVAGQRGSETVVFRLLPDASVDPRFGAGGVVKLPLGTTGRMVLSRVTDTSFAVAGDDGAGIGLVLVR